MGTQMNSIRSQRWIALSPWRGVDSATAIPKAGSEQTGTQPSVPGWALPFGNGDSRAVVRVRFTLSARRALLALAGFVFGLLAAGEARSAGETVKIGFVTFLSGSAAGPFGVPARNAQELMVAAIARGEVPPPYDTAGIAGARIEPLIVDEAGGAQLQVSEFRKLVQKHRVDVVIGYVSSGNCKAIAPVSEELKVLTIMTDCGTPQIFEDIVKHPKYLFRTGAHAAMDGVGAARYLLDLDPGALTVSGINQNYAWGQDSWRDFAASMAQLNPSVTVMETHFPKLFGGQYSAEISALLASGSQAVHSSFWGGDMEALVFQGAARGLFTRSHVILTTGETAMHRLGAQMPDGTILGGRGTHGDFAPKSALNDWFRDRYFTRYGTWPTFPSYRMANAILAVKAAYEKAHAGEAMPDTEAVIAAFEYLEFDTPSGPISMAISNGHQAIQDTAYGQYAYDTENERGTLVNVRTYRARCVNPPEGMASLDWINEGFPGAECAASEPLGVAVASGGIGAASPFSKLAAIVIDGLVYSAWLFVVSVGLTLIYGVMRVLNVAHGSLYAIGAYAAATLVGNYFATGYPPAGIYLLLPAVAIGWGIVVGLLIERGFCA